MICKKMTKTKGFPDCVFVFRLLGYSIIKIRELNLYIQARVSNAYDSIRLRQEKQYRPSTDGYPANNGKTYKRKTSPRGAPI